MTAIPLWATRLFNTPIALDQIKNETLCSFAEQRMLGMTSSKIDLAALEGVQMKANADEAGYWSDSGRKPFMFKGSIAVIPVRGTLIHRGSFVDAQSGLVGYNHILEQARAASRDPDIKGVFSPFDSGGGECAGMYAAAEELASMTKAEGGKPFYAYLDDRACSAAYVLASGYDRVFGRREVIGGSIAAIINLVDKSKAYEKMGLEPYVIRSSWADRKARGQSGEKFDAELIEKMTSLVDQASDQIVEFVSAMRGIKEKAIRDLRGEIFPAADLMHFNLMDDIASEQEAWADLEAEIA